jgi:type 1 glutamine amidotransferase
MKRLALLSCVLLSARASAAPQITQTYPPPEDLRAPDRALSGVGPGPVVAAYSPDGRTLATRGADGVVKIWDARTGEQGTGELVRELEPRRGRIVALSFAPDGRFLTAVADHRTIERWEVATGKVAGTTSLQEVARVLAFGAGKALTLAAQTSKRLALWNLETGEPTTTFAPLDPQVRYLALTPDGKTLAAATAKGAIHLWDVETGALLRTVDLGAPVRSLAAGASHLAAGGADGAVRLVSLQGGVEAVLAGLSGAIGAVAFSGKEDQIAAAAGHAIRVWDTAGRQALCALKGHAARVTTVLFNSNGQKIASASADGAVRYWTVPLPPLPSETLGRITTALPIAVARPKKPRRILVFWRADAILHKGGVPAANKAIELIGHKTGAFDADFSRDYEVLEPKILARYDAIVLNSTAHLAIPDEAKKQALLEYVRRGGGVIGIHAAIDMFKGWADGAQVVGATFGGHPWHPSGTWAVKLDEPGHPLLRAWRGRTFKMHDEFYELAEPYTRSDRRVLMSLDLSDSATAAATPLHRTDKDFAVSWIKRYGEGRVFYCMFGHLADPFEQPAVLQYYLDGIQYALGDLEADATPPPSRH